MNETGSGTCIMASFEINSIKCFDSDTAVVVRLNIFSILLW
jgi:hypothetical protein